MVDRQELDKMLSNMDDYFETVADVQEVKVDEVKEIFTKALDNAIELDPDKSANFIILRAKANLDNIFSNRQATGDTYILIPLTQINSIQDTNKKTSDLLREQFAQGQLENMIRSGKVMTMEILTEEGSKVVPLTSVEKTEIIIKWYKDGVIYDEEVDGGTEVKETYVTEGTPWKKGLPLAYRDYRIDNRWEKFNWGWSTELKPFWEFTLSAIGYSSSAPEDWRMAEIRIRRDQADPNNEAFFFNRYKPFKPYKGNFECWDEKPYIYKLRTYGPVNMLAADIKIEAIDTHVSNVLTTLRENHFDEALKNRTYIPPFIFLPDVKGYHESVVLRDEQNVAITRGEKEYDKIHWNSYAVLSVYVKGVDDKRGLRYILRDASIKRSVYTFTARHIKEQDFKLPASCLTAIKTSRTAYRYDWDEPDKSNRSKYEPGNGDVNITVMSISPIIELDTPKIAINANLM